MIERDTPYLLPPSVQDWLPPGHLARYVVEVVETLDLREVAQDAGGRGRSISRAGQDSTNCWPTRMIISDGTNNPFKPIAMSCRSSLGLLS